MRIQFYIVAVALILTIKTQAQIYNKECIYTFNYKISKNGKEQKGQIFLACYGKLWPITDQKQYLVLWTTDKDEISKNLGSTGIIEDSSRVWMHPPRDGVFSNLEYSPFPEIRLNGLKIAKWEKELLIGDNWSNKEYNIKATDNLRFVYEQGGNMSFQLLNNNIKIDCQSVYAKSTNLQYQTRFLGLFNSKFGFVKMVFNNIDKSTIVFELDNVKEMNSKPKGFPVRPY